MIILDYELIGNKIKDRRKQLGLTQKQLADMVQLSEGSISRYEHGEVRNASMNKLRDFAKVLHVDFTWMVGIKEQTNFETRLKAILKKVENLDEDKQNKLINIIESNVELLMEVDNNERINTKKR